MPSQGPQKDSNTPTKDAHKRGLPVRQTDVSASNVRIPSIYEDKSSSPAKGRASNDKRTSLSSKTGNSSSVRNMISDKSSGIKSVSDTVARPSSRSHRVDSALSARDENTWNHYSDDPDGKGSRSAREMPGISSQDLSRLRSQTTSSHDQATQTSPIQSAQHSLRNLTTQVSTLVMSLESDFQDMNTLQANFVLPPNPQRLPMYPTSTVLDLMNDCKPEELGTLEEFLQGLKVETNYLKDKNGKPKQSILRVIGFGRMREPILNADGTQKKDEQNKLRWKGEAVTSPGDARTLRFPREGRMISVIEHFKSREFVVEVTKQYLTDGLEHDVRLNNPESWVLDCGNKNKPEWIPAEVAFIMDGQLLRGSTTGDLRNQIINASVDESTKKPASGSGTIGIIKALSDSGSGLANFVSTKEAASVSTPALPIPKVSIQYNPNSGSSTLVENGIWNMEDKQVYKSTATKSSWLIILRKGGAFADNQQDMIAKALNTYGLNTYDLGVRTHSRSAISNVQAIEDIEDVLRKSKKGGADMVLVVLPEEDASSWYAEVKYAGDYKLGVQTICLKSSLLKAIVNGAKTDPPRKTDEHAPYYADIALKFNLKAGGINHVLDGPLLGLAANEKVLVIGVEVSHPSQNDGTGQPSMVGVVANIDTKFGQWPGRTRCQPRDVTLVKGLDELVPGRLNAFVKKNGNPSDIIVYCAGISDAQYNDIFENGHRAIEKAWDEIRSSQTRPNITFIIVSKGHQNRFHANDESQAHPPIFGKVVNRNTTAAPPYDFYLQSHSVPLPRPETDKPASKNAKPTHYMVLADTAVPARSCAQMAAITHKLCHLVQTSTRVQSVPAPVWYVGKLCKRARGLLREEGGQWKADVHEELKDTMWYV